jgi:4-hydroxybutyrate CoA-transferase
MKRITAADEAVNARIIPPGTVAALHGSAATPRELCRQLVRDTAIRDVSLISCLPMGEVGELFSQEVCARITHRVTFNTALSRDAQNNGWAKYQLLHLSDIPRQVREYLRPTVWLGSVAGPDNAGNYSLGPMVVEARAAIETARAQGGVVIAERNRKTPFVLGTTVRESEIDFLLDTDYELPVNPAKTPDQRAKRIGEIITALFISDGCTLQYGIGEVPAAVTDGIRAKGVRDLGVHTELYTDAFRSLMEEGIVTNRHTLDGVTVASIFQCGDQAGYDWLHYNCSVASRPSDYTNNALNIARQPKMIAINSAMGADIYGNIWADSVQAPLVYSGVGGQADFLRAARLSPGGVPIVAIKSTTDKGMSKISRSHPPGITTTAVAADPVVIVTEHGAMNPSGLSYVERVVATAHLASPAHRDELLRYVFETPAFNKPQAALREGHPKGFTPYSEI